MSQTQVLRQALLWQLDRWVRYDDIAELLYGLDPDGGPLRMDKYIQLLVFRLRRQGNDIETWHRVGVRLRRP